MTMLTSKSAKNIFAAAALMLLGCTQSVQMRVQRTPNWNTAGIRRVAVMPFEHGGEGRRAFGDGLHKDVARYLTNCATTRLTQTGHFTMISASEVTRLRQSGERLDSHVDALLVGTVISTDVRDSSFIGKVQDPETKEMVDATYYTREATLSISYTLERTRDGGIVGIANKTASARDQQLSRESLNSALWLLQDCGVLSGLAHDLVPYTVTERRVLMSEKTKDKELKNRMGNAAARVRERSYKAALDEYLGIYESYKNLAAVYNAAIMHEALGDLNSAIDLMRRALDDTGNPKARGELARLNRRRGDQEAIEKEYRQAARPVDRVIEHALAEARGVLREDARVWFVVNESSDSDLANAVADGIISAFIRSGVTVVDRENTARIERELVLQMSGGVNDGEILKAGNLAGANIIVTVAVSGSGSARRLQLRVLDVERGVPLLQSGAEDRWNL